MAFSRTALCPHRRPIPKESGHSSFCNGGARPRMRRGYVDKQLCVPKPITPPGLKTRCWRRSHRPEFLPPGAAKLEWVNERCASRGRGDYRDRGAHTTAEDAYKSLIERCRRASPTRQGQPRRDRERCVSRTGKKKSRAVPRAVNGILVPDVLASARGGQNPRAQSPAHGDVPLSASSECDDGDRSRAANLVGIEED